MEWRQVMQAYDAGQRHFGENYVQEICEKAPLVRGCDYVKI